MEMNFYTKRELTHLAMLKQPGMAIDPEIKIDPLKEEIAMNYPEAEWNDWYCKVKMVTYALMELARYNTCKRLQGWTWYVPRTPSQLAFETNPEEKVAIRPVIHPERLDVHLEAIWNRPRTELAEIIRIIQRVEIPGLTWVTWDSVDVNKNFWVLSWVGGPFHNHNHIYLNRR